MITKEAPGATPGGRPVSFNQEPNAPAPAVARTASANSLEYDVKAALLLNFARFKLGEEGARYAVVREDVLLFERPPARGRESAHEVALGRDRLHILGAVLLVI